MSNKPRMLLLGVLFATAGRMAGAIELATTQRVCDTVALPAASPVFETIHTEFDRERRPHPQRAVTLACAELRAARYPMEVLRARVDLGAALQGASRETESAAVLDAAIGDLDAARPDEHALRGEAYLRRGHVRRGLREFPAAGRDYQTARAQLEVAGMRDNVLYAEVLTSDASIKKELRALDDAEHLLKRAEVLLHRLDRDESREAADVLNQRSELAYARQDLAGTLRYSEAEYALTKKLGGPDDLELLDPLITLGAVRGIVGDHDGEDAALREGMRIADVNPEVVVDARLGLLHNVAAAFLERGNGAEALAVSLRAVEIGERQYGSDAIAMHRLYVIAAKSYETLARYPEARGAYARVAGIDAKHGAAIGLLRRLRFFFGDAEVAVRLNDPDAARARIASAVAAMGDEQKLGFWRGWGERIACKLAARRGDWVEADARCAEAARQYAEVLAADNRLIFEVTVGRCLAQAAGRLSGDACDAVRPRIENGSVAHPLLRYLALAGLAQRAEAGGDAGQALDLRVRALAVADGWAVPDPLWTAQYALATSLAASGDRGLAIFFGKRAIESIEAMRSGFGAAGASTIDSDSARLERGFLSDKLAVYRTLADWLLEAGRTPEAIEVLKLLKREEIYDFIERDAKEDDRRARIPYSAAELEFKRALDGMGIADANSQEVDQLLQRRNAKRISQTEDARLTELLAERARIESARAKSYARFIAGRVGTNAVGVASMRVPQLRTTSEAGTADAYIFFADEHLNLVLVAGERSDKRVVAISPAVLNRHVGNYLAALAQRRDPGADGAALYAALGQPLDELAARQGVRRIRLWLDGALRYVPFAALSDGRRYLIEKYEFSYLKGNASAGRRVAPGGEAAPFMVALGVTRAVGQMPALPGIGDELCGIVRGRIVGLDRNGAPCANDGVASGEIEGAGYANDYFTETRLRELTSADRVATRGFGFMHVGTHFSLRPGNMDRSWLLLGDGTHLQLAALRELDFTSVKLVTLSGCQTGMAGGTGDDGREVDGLAAIVQRRGAEAVVASLWRVEDRSAASLMRAFYAGLRRPGTSVPEALRRAQLQAIRQAVGNGAQPYFWAAFIPALAAR